MSPDAVHHVTVEVNGREVQRTVPARRLLIHFLRDDLELRGPHVGCDSGNCGACTIRWNGQLVKSCMMLAVQADGARLETVEGLAGPDGELHPLQRAFSDQHGLQCGFCTPGLLMAAADLLERVPQPTEAQIRKAIKGNICRCTGYVNVVRAIQAAARGAEGGESSALPTSEGTGAGSSPAYEGGRAAPPQEEMTP
jgi:carbon-monoxide dehydrogenase small subunit